MRPEIVRQLLLLGADECALDTDDRTPSDVLGEWVPPDIDTRVEGGSHTEKGEDGREKVPLIPTGSYSTIPHRG